MEENGNETLMHSSCFPSAKKRASGAKPLQHTKKRVPLGELTNSLNITTESSLPSFVLAQNTVVETQKPKGNQKYQKGLLTVLSTQDLESKTCSHSSSMYEYLHNLELVNSQRVSPKYIEEVQNDISANMREILVDWLVEVEEEYKLVSDTLYLTVSYIDRFLSLHTTSKNRLQLLGVSCMLIASKYEEITPPHAEDFCYITDNTYTKEEVLNMENNILKLLNYEMSSPTIKSFLRILTKAAQEDCESPDLQFEFLSSYLAELSLLHYGCVRFLPSAIAASVVFLSRFMIWPKLHPWTMTLQHVSGYRPSDLKECVLIIHQLQLSRKGSSSQAVRDKYSKHKFKCVAKLSLSSEVPLHYFEAIDDK